MNTSINSFGIIVNKKAARDHKLVLKLCEYLLNHGCSVYTSSSILSGKIKIESENLLFKKSKAIFVFGGDGTLLAVARNMGEKCIPLIGIKFGTLGFLMELRAEDLLQAAGEIIDGKYSLDIRQRLKVSIKDGKKTIVSRLVLNDVVVQNGKIARVLKIHLRLGQKNFAAFSADGVIVATPTGSTAYSLSANGPVVFPMVSCFVVTPICPHTLNNRPMIIPETEEVSIFTVKQSALVTFDGQETHHMKKGQNVHVVASRHPVMLIKTEDVSYFQILNEKLGFLMRG